MKLNDEATARVDAGHHGEPTVAEAVADGLVRVPLVTPTLPPATRTNSYLVRGDTGWTLVDLGPDDPDALEQVLAAADALADGRHHVSALLLTHHHGDHVGGITAWRHHVGRPIVAHAETWDRLDTTPRDADVVIDGDGRWDGRRVWHTPGHAPGHLAVESDGGWVVGDLMAGIGTIVIDPADGSVADYLTSLERMASSAGPGWPAHGPGFADVAARAAAYRDHRLAREARVAGALGPEARDLMDVTRRAYADVPEAFHGFASRSALAHLVKLESDGRAVREGGAKWRSVSG